VTTLQLERCRAKAAAFALEWANERDEKGEAHSFWDAFFRVFDLERRHFARHESRVAWLFERYGELVGKHTA
jgi:hypothetical protein